MSDGGQWTITTWNLQGAKSTDLDRVAHVLEQQTPDIVLVQEVRRAQASDLGRRLDLGHVWTLKHQSWAPLFPAAAEGAAILTRHRAGEASHAVVSDVTSRRSWRRRIAMWQTVTRPDDSTVTVFNLHLSPHDLRTERHAEADRVAAIAGGLGSTAPIVVGGDLNDLGDADLLARLPGREHVSVPPTNPADAPQHALDHVLLPDDATDVEVEVPDGGPQWGPVSDHLPVTIRFRLDAG